MSMIILSSIKQTLKKVNTNISQKSLPNNIYRLSLHQSNHLGTSSKHNNSQQKRYLLDNKNDDKKSKEPILSLRRYLTLSLNEKDLIKQDSNLSSQYPQLKSRIGDETTSVRESGRSAKNVTDRNNKVMLQIMGLEAAFARFEDKCQRAEKVVEKDFIKTFDYMTRTYENIESTGQLTDDIKINLSLLSAILIRCCGKLMSDSDLKTRELLAGNLWQFLKEKKIPLDISHYNSLIRVLNENKTNFDPSKILDEINQANLNPDRITYQRLIHQYCLQGDITQATSLLEKMKDLNMELNELTFSSLIIGYSKQENPPTMKEMFDLMKSNNVEPSSKSYATAIISLAQSITKNPASIEELESVFELVEKDDSQFTIYDSIDILASLAPIKDNEISVKIIDYICKTLNYNFNSRTRLFDILLKIGEYERVSKLYWAQEPSELSLRSGNIGVFYIRLLAKYRITPVDFVIKECSQLISKGYNKKAFYHLYYCSAETGNLPVVRASLEKLSEEETIKCQYLWPLIAQAKNEEEIIYFLKNDINPQMNTNDLIDTFSQWVWPKFADNVDRLFELNKELNYDNNLLMASFLNYSVQEDKVMDAIKFVSEASQDLVDSAGKDNSMNNDDSYNNNLDSIVSVNARQQRMRNDRGTLIGKLLNQIAEHTKDPAMVSKAFSLCKLPGQQVSNRSANALVKVHLLNDDYKSAIEIFLKLAKEEQVTPCKTDLMIHCLEKKDPESLQKIMDASTDIYGEVNSLFDLAVCCLKCKKLKQARKIFASPGFRLNPSRVYLAAKQLANSGNIDVLENYVHLTRDMYDINQETLYQILIDAYEKTSNGERALDLWNRMQEEEFQPSKRSLLMIANVLERNGIEVPFQKPKLDLRNEGRFDRRNDDYNY